MAELLNKRPERRIWFILNAFCILSAAGLLIIAFAAYRNFQAVLEKDARVERSAHFIDLTEKVESMIVDAETGQRGYIITADSIYLQPYFSIKDSVYLLVDQMEQLAENNQEQQRHLQQLRNLMNKRLQLLDYSIALKNQEQEAKVRQFFRTKYSKHVMDRLKSQIHLIEQKEQQTLATGNRLLDEGVTLTRKLIFGIIAAAFFMNLSIVFLLIRAFQKQNTYEHNILLANQDLYAFNEELQAANEHIAAANEEINRTTEMLKESEARAHLGHWEVDYTTTPPGVFLSDEAHRIFGIPSEVKPIRLEYVQSFILPEDLPKVQQRIENMLNKGQNYASSYRIRRADGQIRYMETKGFPTRNKEGKVTFARGITQDITERKQLELTLQQANDELEQKVAQRTQELSRNNEELTRTNTDLDNFVYAASHDLKHPITNLEGLLSIFPGRSSASSDKDYQQWLDFMHESVTRLRTTIDQLTDISRIQKGIDQDTESLSFADLTTELQQEMAQLIDENQATIHTDFQVPFVNYSPKNLRSILYNLMSNAIKYRKPQQPAEVFLHTFHADGRTVLTVRDKGLGLSTEEQGKLFNMFKRLHSHVEGTGIGLYMVKRIVENAGGHIYVSSQLNEGTTFTIHF